MPKFHVEDRNRGIVVLYGSIGSDNEPMVEESDPSLDRSMLPGILDAIRADLGEGYSGGRLPIAGLEWFVLRQA